MQTHTCACTCIFTYMMSYIQYCPAVMPPLFATYFQEKEGRGRNNEDLRFRLAVKPPPPHQGRGRERVSERERMSERERERVRQLRLTTTSAQCLHSYSTCTVHVCANPCYQGKRSKTITTVTVAQCSATLLR